MGHGIHRSPRTVQIIEKQNMSCFDLGAVHLESIR